MEVLKDVQLFGCQSGREFVLKSAPTDLVIGLYFCASWAPPCQQLTPRLASMHAQLLERGASFEIILCSCDKSLKAMTDHMKGVHADWLYFPYDDSINK